MNKRYFYFIFCWLIASTALSAEQKKKNPIDCQGDKVEYIKEEKKVVGTGNVVVTYEGVRLTADKIVIYMDTQDALAYGKAVLYKDNNVFCGENLSYNFGTKKGSIIDSMFEAPPWYGRGKKMDKIGDETVLYRKGYFTTCENETPHYRMVSNRIKIYLGDKLVANNVVFFVGQVPLLYIPRYSHPLNDDRPRVTIIPGKKKQWGVFVLSAWRYYFNENARGVIRLDWREFTGVAGGFDYNYKIDDYGQGELKFYYMQERDRRKKEGVHAERQRYSIDYKHEWRIDKNSRLFGEYHRYGERDFRYDYFYEAYEKEAQPETQISFTHVKSNYSIEGYLRKRVNRFENVVEKLPEVSLDISSLEIGDSNFYYDSESSAANLNIKTDHSAEDTDAVRFDNYNQLSYPTRFPGYFKWISFTPYIGERQTFYNKDKEGSTHENFFRGIYYGGFDMSTRFYRAFDVEKDLWNIEINKLRHLIQPSIEYDYIHRPTVSSGKLGAFDSIDSISKSNYYTFSIENSLQTKWPVKTTDTIRMYDPFSFEAIEEKSSDLQIGDMESVDLVSLLTKVYFYPHPEELVSPFSNIYGELDLKPYRWLTAEVDSSYDHSTRDFDGVNVDLTATKPNWDFTLGSRYVKKSSCEVTTDLNYILNNKWKFGVMERYEFKGDEALTEQEYRITRDLHCWLLDITYNIKDGESYWVVFRLKAFPEIPFEFTTAYHQPKEGSEIPPP